jgi:maltooligosyltrehalose trehalohydrolase
MTNNTTRFNSPRHGFQSVGEGGVWNVWAPKAQRLDLVLFHGRSDREVVRMEPVERSWYRCHRPVVPTGLRYAFQLDGNAPRPDPASRWQPDGVHAPSAIWRPNRETSSGETGAPPSGDSNAWIGLRQDQMVLYELHVGTFTREGTFDAVIPRLTELKDLGVTAIELMPVGQFPGARGWGYDGTYWFAPQSSYGGPAGLLRLVAACHRVGLGIFLDVIYNHLGPEGNYLHEFGPYFTERYSTPWGAAVNFDGEGCEGARTLVLDNVRHWLHEFGFDGLRLDAVHAIFDNSPAHILADIQRVATEEGTRLGRRIQVIAESDLNDTLILAPADGSPDDRLGYGVDAQWCDDFHHTVHALVTGERNGYYADFDDPCRQLVKALDAVFVYDGQHSRVRGRPHGAPAKGCSGERFVVSIQTHDQVGNRARGERLASLTTPAQMRLAAGLLLFAPRLPMLFMGEEYGETNPFPFFCDFGDPALRAAVQRGREAEFAGFAWSGDVPDATAADTFESAILSWSWQNDLTRHGLRQLYRDLLALRRDHPGCHDFINVRPRLIEWTRADFPGSSAPSTSSRSGTINVNLQGAAVAPGTSSNATVLVLERGEAGSLVTGVFNLGTTEFADPIFLQSLGERLISSEERLYGGPGIKPGLLPGWSFAIHQGIKETHA